MTIGNEVSVTAEITTVEVGVCVDATVENSDQTFTDTVGSGATLVLDDITHTDSDGSSAVKPAQIAFVSTLCIDTSILDFEFGATGEDEMERTLGANQAGTYDLDAATLTNVATDVYEKNSVVVTGSQTFVATDTLKVTITRTVSSTLSR